MSVTARATSLRRLTAITAVAGLVLLAFGVVSRLGRAPADAGPRRLAGFTERDVAVEVTLERDAGGRPVLAARFAPTRPGFHLYARELPRAGLRGIGRPTLLEIVRAPALRPAGPLQADRPSHALKTEMLGLTFPVYPEGPVTLRQPVTFTEATDRTVELSVTYMACSARACLPPQEDRRIIVRL